MDEKLPILAHREQIVDTVRRHQAVVIAGETGSGKTTVVPRFLLEEGVGGGIIGITEPRRIAAVSVATYVAGGFGEEVGGLVGYQIRHENRTDPDATRIKYMTEGVLLREMLADPLLGRYGVIVLDEVHERNVHQDLLLALMKDLMPRRPDLKVIAMSATIDEERFASYLGAPIVRIKGRMFPVTIEHAFETASEHVEAAVEKTQEMLRRTTGDVLVFMPDYESIRKTMEQLEETPYVKTGVVDVLPLYGNQSPDEQRAVLLGRERRSVIVATNVAETSVTLDGVTAVVDTGLVKEMRYFPSTSTSSLKVVRHSKAGCDQRAGRAGRTAPGICARLYAQDDYEDRRPYTTPEILRSSLDQVFLQLRAMGLEERTIMSFDFPEPPSPKLWKDARQTLELLGALDEDGELTDDGELMAEIPLPPKVTRMIFTARRHGCVAAVTTVAASFSTRPIFVRPPGREEEADAAHHAFRDQRSDFLTLLNAVKRWRNSDREKFAERFFLHRRALEEIEAVEKQIAAILAEHGIESSTGTNAEDIGRAIASGLVANLLESAGGRAYKGRKLEGIFIFPGSSLYQKSPRYIVAAEIVETKRKYARDVQEVPTRWLEDILGRPSHRHRKRKRERFRRNQRRH